MCVSVTTTASAARSAWGYMPSDSPFHFSSNRRLSTKMWRAVFSLLFVLLFNGGGGREYYRFGPSLTAATNIYTESGSNQAYNAGPAAPEDYYGFDASAKLSQQQQPSSSYAGGYDDTSDEGADQRLASIVGELYQRGDNNANYPDARYGDAGGMAPAEDYYAPKVRSERTNDDYSKLSGVESELDQLRQLSERIKQLQSSPDNNNNGEPEQADGTGLSPDDDESAAATAESARTKKGQNEYVGFVAPGDSKKMKHVEALEKRRPLDSDEDDGERKSHAHQALSFISGSGNIVFLAFITMCCVLSVMGVVGGMYYYNNARSRHEDPFDDFTRYSPAGPGRDRLKKGGATTNGVNGGAVGAFAGEKGDDALAYKAQLHHYQQTKQKIIGSAADDALGACGSVAGGDTSDKSDDEDDADLEHNFSVYECPGLAPTGDIEVQNPNFVDSPTQHEKK